MHYLTAVILTFNEELHIERALRSIEGVCTTVYVIDSGSTDQTVRIAESMGAVVLCNPWKNHSAQFNWALDQLPPETEWVLRLDADEYLCPPLPEQLRQAIANASPDLDGIYVRRRMAFQGKVIRHGGVFPLSVLRAFRYGRGRCEARWMDEHIEVKGRTVELRGEILDDNLRSLTWWTEKHNHYASREVIDLLNARHRFEVGNSIAALRRGKAERKRWIKENIYNRLPLGVRPAMYFLYRYIIRLGFLDGRSGLTFHFLQGFWYRYLVDAKYIEADRYMRSHSVDASTAIQRLFAIEIARSGSTIHAIAAVSLPPSSRGTPKSLYDMAFQKGKRS